MMMMMMMMMLISSLKIKWPIISEKGFLLLLREVWYLLDIDGRKQRRG
ncbi:hypothetical protein HanPI659440_Chr13g0522191 [Helianthus annuus]|nr:hypothetical protein HanPI659440_Chr13g0522191 [Helianthus annuus]